MNKPDNKRNKRILLKQKDNVQSQESNLFHKNQEFCPSLQPRNALASFIVRLIFNHTFFRAQVRRSFRSHDASFDPRYCICDSAYLGFPSSQIRRENNARERDTRRLIALSRNLIVHLALISQRRRFFVTVASEKRRSAPPDYLCGI